MKKLILGIIIILLSYQAIFGMEKGNENKFNILSELAKHHPDLPMKIIEQGIKSELRSDSDPAKAVINAFKYINTVMMIDKSWYSQKTELIAMLKALAKKELAPEYSDLNQEKLNNILNKVVIYLFKNAEDLGIEFDDIRQDMLENTASLRNDYVKLIIAGANPNVEITQKIGEIPANQSFLQVMIDLEDVNFVSLLLLYGADANHKNSAGNSPLVSAIVGHSRSSIEKVKQIIRLLIMFGADVNERTEAGVNIPISWTILSKRPILLELLLTNGAELSEKGISLMKEAILYCNPKFYKTFIEIFKKYGYQI